VTSGAQHPLVVEVERLAAVRELDHVVERELHTIAGVPAALVTHRAE
jgi:hypothetical protein